MTSAGKTRSTPAAMNGIILRAVAKRPMVVATLGLPLVLSGPVALFDRPARPSQVSASFRKRAIAGQGLGMLIGGRVWQLPTHSRRPLARIKHSSLSRYLGLATHRLASRTSAPKIER